MARDAAKLEELAVQLGDRASSGTVDDAVAFGEIVILSVPWGAIPEALAQAGDLSGKVVIDTTNQFGSGPKPEPRQTAAAFNAQRMPGARYFKSFNTHQPSDEFFGCGIIDLGSTQTCEVMEPPPGCLEQRRLWIDAHSANGFLEPGSSIPDAGDAELLTGDRRLKHAHGPGLHDPATAVTRHGVSGPAYAGPRPVNHRGSEWDGGRQLEICCLYGNKYPSPKARISPPHQMS